MLYPLTCFRSETADHLSLDVVVAVSCAVLDLSLPHPVVYASIANSSTITPITPEPLVTAKVPPSLKADRQLSHMPLFIRTAFPHHLMLLSLQVRPTLLRPVSVRHTHSANATSLFSPQLAQRSLCFSTYPHHQCQHNNRHQSTHDPPVCSYTSSIGE